MTEPGQIETETPRPLAEEIWIAMEKRPGNKEYISPQRRREQELVLQNLPPDFEMRMKAFATNALPANKDQLFTLMFGEIFEELVRADKNMCPTPENEEEVLLRSLLKSPGMFGLEEHGIGASKRNPDLARVNKQTGEVEGAVEIKTKFDQRSLKQLQEFEGNFEELIGKLHEIGEESPGLLRNHGLAPIADNLDNLKVAENFRITLAYPYLKPYNNKPERFLDPKKFDTPGDYEEMSKRILESNFIQSPFGKGDIRFITELIIDHLQKTNQVPIPPEPIQEFQIPHI